MEVFISLIIAVAAGVISHLICKWLDNDKKQATSLWSKPP